MGTTTGAIAIKTDLDKVEPLQLLESIFNITFRKVNEYIDTRIGNNVYFVKCSDGYIWIHNSKICDGIIHNGDTNFIKQNN